MKIFDAAPPVESIANPNDFHRLFEYNLKYDSFSHWSIQESDP